MVRRQTASATFAVVTLALLAIAASGCRSGPSPEEVARLRDEVHAEDARLRSAREASAREPWSIEIRTGVAGVKLAFDIEALDKMATDEIVTVGPAPDTAYRADHTYRGVRVSRLIESGDAGPEADVVVFGADGFWSAIVKADVVHAPILLAVERDGARIPRRLGGPVLLALPIASHPDLVTRYGENGWCFYVTAVASGRPRARIRVNGVVREPSEMVQRGVIHRKQVMRLRSGWSAAEHAIVGPRLADVVPRDPARSGAIKVWSFGRENGGEVIVTPEELATCDPLLVLGEAPMTEPIALRLGGPAILAPLPSCKAEWARAGWPAFVDTLEALP